MVSGQAWPKEADESQREAILKRYDVATLDPPAAVPALPKQIHEARIARWPKLFGLPAGSGLTAPGADQAIPAARNLATMASVRRSSAMRSGSEAQTMLLRSSTESSVEGASASSPEMSAA
jgi:hypothetical protein